MNHWVFDLDGTLVDTLDQYFAKLEKIFAHFDVPFTDVVRSRALDYFDTREFLSLHLNDIHLDEACRLLGRLSVEYAAQARIFEGMLDLLQFLNAKGVHLSLWTGRDEASARSILQHTGLHGFFKSFVSGTCVVKKKPNPEGLLKLLDMTGFQGHESIMVGDHLYDLQGARASGVQSISVSWLKGGPHPLEALSDRHFYRVPDLLHWAQSRFDTTHAGPSV